jgi:amino acid adenylation domain-containing protein
MTSRSHPGLPDPRQPLSRRFEAPIHELVLAQAIRTPDVIAVEDSESTWTYVAVAHAACLVGDALREAGVNRGDVVAVYAHRSAALVPALLGVLRIGAAFSVLDPSHPSARLVATVEALRPRGCVSLDAAGALPADVTAALRREGCASPVSVGATPAQRSAIDADRALASPGLGLAADDLAYVAFTSGTTGRPKGILGPHGPLPHFVRWHVETFGFDRSDRFGMLSGLAHDPLLRDVFTPLAIGASLAIPPELRRPDVLRAWLDERRVSAVHLTPTLGELLLQGRRPGETLRHLRYAFFGAEPLHAKFVERFRAFAPGAELVLFYGATETPQAVAYHRVDRDERGFVPLGRGIDAVQLLVVGDDGELAPPGIPGEIHVRTPYLAAGYLCDDELTASRFVRNPFTDDPADRMYRTGDLGRYRDDGVVEFTGRRDDQVKIRGFRVELGDVVSGLLSHPGVARATAVVRRDVASTGSDRTLLVAYVVPAHAGASRTALVRELRDHLKARLPEHMVPGFISVIDALPLTPNGKIDAAALPPPDRRAAVGEDLEPATDDLETQLVAIWKRLLNVERIGIDDDFFDLGGDSLLAVQAVAEVEADLRRRCPLGVLFESGTIRAVAAALRADAPAQDTSPIVVPLQDRGDGPVLFCLCGVNIYQELADALAPTLRTCGIFLPIEERLFAVGADDAGVSVEELAAGYVRVIRSRQAHGPYLLAGISFGGVLAFEAAQQLVRAGEAVTLVAMLDTMLPGALRRDYGRWVAEQVRLAYEHGVKHLLRRVARRLRRRPTAKSIAAESRRLDEVRANATSTATQRYAIQPYAGRGLLVRAVDKSYFGSDVADATYGWGALVKRLFICDVPGDHIGILKEPNVRELARELLAHVEAADREAPELSGTG